MLYVALTAHNTVRMHGWWILSSKCVIPTKTDRRTSDNGVSSTIKDRGRICIRTAVYILYIYIYIICIHIHVYICIYVGMLVYM